LFVIRSIHQNERERERERESQPLSTSFTERPMIIFFKCIGSMVAPKEKKKIKKKQKIKSL
jgi:hypothetical protein